MLSMLRDDVRMVLARDPAAHHWLPVLLFTPGLHAVWAHRLAHRLWRARLAFPARLIASLSRWLTGVEIHPAARIGARLFIDHGMGVVIGETAEVGDDVTIYHGVTLGGVDLSPGKRHPTIEDGVVIGAGAKVLGDIRIGRDTRIGANAVVVENVGANMVVVGVPGKPLGRDRTLVSTERPDLHHDRLPDVVARELEALRARVEQLENDARRREESSPARRSA